MNDRMKQAYQNIKLYLSRAELIDMDNFSIEELEEVYSNTENKYKAIRAKRAFVRKMISEKQRLEIITNVVEGMTVDERKHAQRVLKDLIPPKS